MNELNIYIGFVEAAYKAIEVSLLFSCLKPKLNKILTFFLIWIPTGIIQIISAVNNFKYTALSLLMFAVFIGLTVLLFKSRIQDKLMVSLSLTMICALVSMGYFAFSNMRGIYEYFHYDKIGTLTALIIMCGIEIVFTLFWQKKAGHINIGKEEMASFSLLLITQIAICLAFQLMNVPEVWAKTNHVYYFDSINVSIGILFIGVILFLLVDFFMYRSLIRIYKSTKEAEELKFRSIQDKLNIEHYELLKENSEKVHKIKHDIANIIEIAGALAISEHNDDNNRVKGILDELNILFGDIENDSFCNHKLINIILCAGCSKFKQKGIQYNIVANVPADLSVSDTDICRIFTNLFDNAIYATEQSENPNIDIEILTKESYLYIKVSNTTSKSPKKREGDHGYGTKILKEVAEKYDGSFLIKSENNYFTAMEVLKAVI